MVIVGSFNNITKCFRVRQLNAQEAVTFLSSKACNHFLEVFILAILLANLVVCTGYTSFMLYQ